MSKSDKSKSDSAAKGEAFEIVEALAAKAVRRDERTCRNAPVDEFDIFDMFDFANALAKLNDDQREDVRALINEDFGAIDLISMRQVRRALRAARCTALDDLLEEFFMWHTNDLRERVLDATPNADDLGEPLSKHTQIRGYFKPQDDA